MQLTRFTDYGLRSLMYLTAHQERFASVKEISDYYNISRNHIAKVIYRLSQLDLIKTRKGKNGGIRLTANALKKPLGEIIKLLETNMDLVECFDHKNNSCKITNFCQLKHYLYEARHSFINVLNKYTLADTVNDKKLFSQ